MVEVSKIGGDDILPVKLEIVARALRREFNTLNEGGRIRFPRKKVRDALGCGKYVSDDEILNILGDKLSILERENIFDGKGFDTGYEKNMETNEPEPDRVIWVEFKKVKATNDFGPSLSGNNLKAKDDDPSEATVGGKKVKNQKFLNDVKEQERRRAQSERDKEAQQKTEEQEKTDEKTGDDKVE